MSKETTIICKNVFQSGTGTTKAEFTNKWAELINQQEKNKDSVIQGNLQTVSN